MRYDSPARAAAVRMSTGRAILPIALLAGALLAALPSRSALAASPQTLIVQLRDITQTYGAGFSLTYGIPISKKSFASGNGTLQNIVAGFTGGYGAAYQRLGTFKHGSGPYSVTSTAAVYTQAIYPHRAIQRSLKDLNGIAKRSAGYASSVKATALHGVGDEAILETLQVKSRAASYAVTLLFRRGRYTGTLSVLSRTPLSSAGAIRLAQVMDAKMQHAP